MLGPCSPDPTTRSPTSPACASATPRGTSPGGSPGSPWSCRRPARSAASTCAVAAPAPARPTCSTPAASSPPSTPSCWPAAAPSGWQRPTVSPRRSTPQVAAGRWGRPSTSGCPSSRRRSCSTSGVAGPGCTTRARPTAPRPTGPPRPDRWPRAPSAPAREREPAGCAVGSARHPRCSPRARPWGRSSWSTPSARRSGPTGACSRRTWRPASGCRRRMPGGSPPTGRRWPRSPSGCARASRRRWRWSRPMRRSPRPAARSSPGCRTTGSPGRCHRCTPPTTATRCSRSRPARGRPSPASTRSSCRPRRPTACRWPSCGPCSRPPRSTARPTAAWPCRRTATPSPGRDRPLGRVAPAGTAQPE